MGPRFRELQSGFLKALELAGNSLASAGMLGGERGPLGSSSPNPQNRLLPAPTPLLLEGVLVDVLGSFFHPPETPVSPQKKTTKPADLNFVNVLWRLKTR